MEGRVVIGKGRVLGWISSMGRKRRSRHHPEAVESEPAWVIDGCSKKEGARAWK